MDGSRDVHISQQIGLLEFGRILRNMFQPLGSLGISLNVAQRHVAAVESGANNVGVYYIDKELRCEGSYVIEVSQRSTTSTRMFCVAYMEPSLHQIRVNFWGHEPSTEALQERFIRRM